MTLPGTPEQGLMPRLGCLLLGTNWKTSLSGSMTGIAACFVLFPGMAPWPWLLIAAKAITGGGIVATARLSKDGVDAGKCKL